MIISGKRHSPQLPQNRFNCTEAQRTIQKRRRVFERRASTPMFLRLLVRHLFSGSALTHLYFFKYIRAHQTAGNGGGEYIWV